ncbi:hypothetical protein, partial [Phenylobacterium sp.]|uniref:hypothetical protein n=1 Tax=Phenylobacterium sp. TaxID=1871053 RepID=UPI002E2F78DC
MKRALVLAMVLMTAPAAAGSAQAQALGGGPMASAPAPRGDRHGGVARHHRRLDPIARWERRLEQARARGNATGRDPWSSYSSAPPSRFPRSQLAQSRLAESQLWSGGCWRRDCDEGVFAGPAYAMSSAGPPAAAAAPPVTSAPAPSAFAP